MLIQLVQWTQLDHKDFLARRGFKEFKKMMESKEK